MMLINILAIALLIVGILILLVVSVILYVFLKSDNNELDDNVLYCTDEHGYEEIKLELQDAGLLLTVDGRIKYQEWDNEPTRADEEILERG